jgi:hypothetical protein
MKLDKSLTYRILALFIVTYGIFINLYGSNNILEQISYFTMASNTTVLLVLMITIVDQVKLLKINPTFLKILKGSAVSSNLVTVLIYTFVLVPYLSANNIQYQIFGFKDILIHYVTPILVFLDFILFDEKGIYEIKDVIKFIYYPFGYIAYIIVYVLLGGRFTITGTSTIFPYFFLNYQRQGVPLTLLIMFSISLLFVGLGGIVYLLDKTLKRNIKKISL